MTQPSWTPANREPNRGEAMAISVTALRGAPWRGAAAGGALLGLGNFGLHVLGGHLLSALLHGVSIGVTAFVVILAGAALFAKDSGDRVTRRSRQWARRNPWRFAMLPALLAAGFTFVVELLTGHLFGAVFGALGRGLVVLVLVGVLGLLASSRHPEHR